MALEGYIALFVVLVVIIALIKEAMRPGLVLFSAALVFMITGIISPSEMVAGFSNKGMLTVAFLFLVSEGVRLSGALNKVASLVLPKRRYPMPRLLLTIMAPISAMSAFLNNTPLIIIFAPIVSKWSEKMKFSPSKFLIPLSYATIFGGMCTLIGTSTNLVVHGLLLENKLPGISMFEIGKVGLPIMIIGILYVSFIGHKLLPDGKNFNRKNDRIDTKEYYFNLTVTEKSKYIGEVIRRRKLSGQKDLTVISIERGDLILDAQKDRIVLQKGDKLLICGLDENVGHLLKINGLEVNAQGDLHEFIKAEDGDLHRIEVVLAPRFPGIGLTLDEFDFYNRYKGIVLAIHRNGSNLTSNLNQIRLRPGDSLILLAGNDFIENWCESKVFFLISSKGEMEKPVTTYKLGWTIAILVTMIVGSTFGQYLPTLNGNAPDMFLFSGLAAMLMAWMKIFPPKKYTKAISWDVLITIACAFALSQALINSGAADILANGAINSVKRHGPQAVLAVIYLITMVCTEVMTNNAAAALTFPIALAASTKLGVDPKPFMIAICVAASSSFSTPIGYQTNMIVQSIGNYKFRDFMRIGIPLNIITFILSVLLIPLIWSF